MQSKRRPYSFIAHRANYGSVRGGKGEVQGGQTLADIRDENENETVFCIPMGMICSVLYLRLKHRMY